MARSDSRSITIHTIDLMAIASSAVLLVLLSILLLGGAWCAGHQCWFDTRPQVRQFSWQNQVIRAQDEAFILEFDRPMNHESVEENLKITLPEQPAVEAPLPGKVSWSGRRLAYTLDFPAPYGNQYRLELEGAKEQFQGQDQTGQTLRPFIADFQTPDRVLVYIGVTGKERGRLVLYNLTQQTQDILTPETLVVTEFEPYSDGRRILFTAVERSQTKGILEQQLYRVTTGYRPAGEALNSKTIAGQVELLLDNVDYQLLKFDLSADGELVVMQRVKRDDPTDVGLWLLPEGEDPIALRNPPGGVFEIAPDNQLIASAQGEGIALLSLEPGADPLDFLGQFGMILGFSPDGRQAALVDFNREDPDRLYVRSLYLVNNQGKSEKIFDVEGSILGCQFTPTGQEIYCLLSRRLSETDYTEQPYLAFIDRITKDVTPLTKLPSGQEVRWHLAPDGLIAVFDQVETDLEFEGETVLKTDSSAAIVGSKLWVLFPSTQPETDPVLEELPLAGIRPQWLP
ncbi:MAG: hypothetical protein F6J87_03845 [Spirulina sp. SIO3F2]|nr:hypothetical protein [Spirulina sp. SIO3F2]